MERLGLRRVRLWRPASSSSSSLGSVGGSAVVSAGLGANCCMSAAKELELVVHIGRDELDGVAQWIDAGARSQLAPRATSLAASVQACKRPKSRPSARLLPAVMCAARTKTARAAPGQTSCDRCRRRVFSSQSPPAALPSHLKMPEEAEPPIATRLVQVKVPEYAKEGDLLLVQTELGLFEVPISRN